MIIRSMFFALSLSFFGCLELSASEIPGGDLLPVEEEKGGRSPVFSNNEIDENLIAEARDRYQNWSKGVVADNEVILSNIIHSLAYHEQFGGVVPEIAARAHLKNLESIVEEALKDAGIEHGFDLPKFPNNNLHSLIRILSLPQEPEKGFSDLEKENILALANDQYRNSNFYTLSSFFPELPALLSGSKTLESIIFRKSIGEEIRMTGEQWKSIFKALSEQGQVRSLKLENCQIEEEGITYLCQETSLDWRKKVQTLEFRSLGGCKISSDVFVQLLKAFPGLESFKSIASCSLEDPLVFNDVSLIINLKTLRFSFDTFSVETLKSLSQHLEKLPNLEKLEIINTHLGDDAVPILLEMKTKRLGLDLVCSMDTDISKEAVRPFTRLFEQQYPPGYFDLFIVGYKGGYIRMNGTRLLSFANMMPAQHFFPKEERRAGRSFASYYGSSADDSKNTESSGDIINSEKRDYFSKQPNDLHRLVYSHADLKSLVELRLASTYFAYDKNLSAQIERLIADATIIYQNWSKGTNEPPKFSKKNLRFLNRLTYLPLKPEADISGLERRKILELAEDQPYYKIGDLRYPAYVRYDYSSCGTICLSSFFPGLPFLLSESITLQLISFDNVKMTNSQWKNIFKALSRQGQVRSLKLENCQIAEGDITYLCQETSLDWREKVQTFEFQSLEGCKISSDVFVQLLKAFPGLESFKSIASCSLEAPLVFNDISFILNLKTLGFNLDAFPVSVLRSLSQYLGKFLNLEELRIRNTHLGDGAASILSEIENKKPGLVLECFDNTGISGKAMRPIVGLLKEQKSFQGISYNSFSALDL